ncbi:hypothetical protein NDU88_000658 [Pleurodeles waltl]|uniref:Uncharacterized protein n=1 Tax=Pleurodeles waltl TaxID=8319 RepID=A0AAV7VY05_PLEWA|nr:hypothetical protein NDU88_000658 [Pleurodeles waltl]
MPGTSTQPKVFSCWGAKKEVGATDPPLTASATTSQAPGNRSLRAAPVASRAGPHLKARSTGRHRSNQDARNPTPEAQGGEPPNSCGDPSDSPKRGRRGEEQPQPSRHLQGPLAQKGRGKPWPTNPPKYLPARQWRSNTAHSAEPAPFFHGVTLQGFKHTSRSKISFHAADPADYCRADAPATRSVTAILQDDQATPPLVPFCVHTLLYISLHLIPQSG